MRERALRTLIRLLGRLGEPRVERWLGSRLGLRALFTLLARSYDPKAGRGFAGCLTWELTRPSTGAAPAVWTIEIAGGRARARPGRCAAPALTLTIGLVDLLRIGGGLLDPVAAVLQGRGSFSGPLELAVRLPEMFGAVRPG